MGRGLKFASRRPLLVVADAGTADAAVVVAASAAGQAVVVGGGGIASANGAAVGAATAAAHYRCFLSCSNNVLRTRKYPMCPRWKSTFAAR